MVLFLSMDRQYAPMVLSIIDNLNIYKKVIQYSLLCKKTKVLIDVFLSKKEKE